MDCKGGARMTQTGDTSKVRGGSASAPIRIVLMLASTIALLAASAVLIAAVAGGRDAATWLAGFAVGAAGIALSFLTTAITARY